MPTDTLIFPLIGSVAAAAVWTALARVIVREALR